MLVNSGIKAKSIDSHLTRFMECQQRWYSITCLLMFLDQVPGYDLLFWKYLINNEGIMERIMARCTNASTMMTNLVASDF